MVALLLSLWSLFDADRFAALFDRLASSSPRVRGFLAVAPWIGALVLILAAGTWWSQQNWAPRLLATYMAVVWSLVWSATHSSDVIDTRGSIGDGFVRRLLKVLAAVLVVLGLNGLVLGLGLSGLAASALAACAGFIALCGANLAQPPLRARFAAAGVGLVIGMTSVEVGLRALHLGESVGERDDEEYVRQFHYMPPPGSAFVSVPNQLDEFSSTLIEINSLGIRGPEIPQGQVDVLLIGDSMIESRQLPWDQTLGARLPAALAARSSQAHVVAHGVRGWAPLLEWNWYLKVGHRLKPRTVLLFFFWNDLWTRGTEAQTFNAVLGPTGRPDHFEVLVESGWVWFKHVRAIRLADEARQRFTWQTLRWSVTRIGATGAGLDLERAKAAARRMAGDALLTPGEVETILTKPVTELDPKLRRVAWSEFWPGLRPISLWTDEQRRAAANTALELRRFAEDVAGDGGRLAIVYVPNAFQIAPNECAVARYLVGLDDGQVLPEDSGIQTWLRATTEDAGIDLLDPSDAMRAFVRARPQGAPPLHLRADCHWSAAGQQFMAGYLADWLVSARTDHKTRQ